MILLTKMTICIKRILMSIKPILVSEAVAGELSFKGTGVLLLAQVFSGRIPSPGIIINPVMVQIYFPVPGRVLIPDSRQGLPSPTLGIPILSPGLIPDFLLEGEGLLVTNQRFNLDFHNSKGVTKVTTQTLEETNPNMVQNVDLISQPSHWELNRDCVYSA